MTIRKLSNKYNMTFLGAVITYKDCIKSVFLSIVPGDIIELKENDIIPCDSLLIEGKYTKFMRNRSLLC